MGVIVNTVKPPSDALGHLGFDLKSGLTNGVFQTGHRTDEIMKMSKNKQLNLNHGASICPVAGEL